METYGRLGQGGQQALERLAAEASTHGRGPGATARLVLAWRLALERAVLFAQADIVLLSLGATSMQEKGCSSIGRNR
jgi:hypothetical protein